MISLFNTSGDVIVSVDLGGRNLGSVTKETFLMRFAVASKASLNELHLKGKSIGKTDLNSIGIDKALFDDCDLSKLLCKKTNFKGCTFVNCKMPMFMPMAMFSNCTLVGCTFGSGDNYEGVFSHINFINSELTECNFNGVRLFNCYVINSILNKTNFVSSKVEETGFNKTEFSGVSFRGTTISENDFEDSFFTPCHSKDDEIKTDGCIFFSNTGMSEELKFAFRVL